MDDRFILTDKGEVRFGSLQEKYFNQSPMTSLEFEDYGVLNSISRGIIPVTGSGTEWGSILRRLFEGGYIDYA